MADLKFGNTSISDLALGQLPVQALILGETTIWQRGSSSTPSLYPSSANATGDAGATVTLSVSDPNNNGWSLYCSNSSISYSQTTGVGSETVTIGLPANTTGVNRHFIISLLDEFLQETFGSCDITQAYLDETSVFDIQSDDTVFDSLGGDGTIILGAPNGSPWRFVYNTNDSSQWYLVDAASGTGTGAYEEIGFSFDPNTTGQDRYLDITVYSGSSSTGVSLRIIQEG